MIKDFNSFTRIATCSVAGVATQIVTGRATLERICINDVSTAYTIGIIDNTTGSTINVGTLKTNGTGVVTPDRTFNITVSAGIRIISTGKSTTLPDFVVVYRQ